MARNHTHPMVTETDRHRIEQSVATYGQAFGSPIPAARELHRHLSRCESVESKAIPADRVTMNSVVRIRWHGQATEQETLLHLSYPGVSAPGRAEQSVSVLSPVGVALLGSRQGQRITWTAPGGRMEGTVISVIYQPEACGDDA